MNQVYQQLRPNFYCFPMPQMVLGVEFAEIQDALFFQILINKYCPKFDHDKISKHEYKEQLLAKNGMTKQFSRPISCKTSGDTWFNIGTQTFIIEQIPWEIKNLIKAIGYRKKDLIKPDTAGPIYKILKEGLEKTINKNEEEVDKAEEQ